MKNAFDSVTKMTMLWRVRHLWPYMSRFASNCYRHQIRMVVRMLGKCAMFTLSKVGVAQGDPFVMALYGIMLPPSSFTSSTCFQMCSSPGLPMTTPWTGTAARL